MREVTVQTLAQESGAPIEFGPGSYTPGVCNIGAREVAIRRRLGIAALMAAAVLALALVVADAPVAARWIVAVPVGFGVVGLLQARRRFCVQFAVMGISDPGDEETALRVDDPADRAADRRTARAIVLQSFAIALVVTTAFVVLPL